MLTSGSIWRNFLSEINFSKLDVKQNSSYGKIGPNEYEQTIEQDKRAKEKHHYRVMESEHGGRVNEARCVYVAIFCALSNKSFPAFYRLKPFNR